MGPIKLFTIGDSISQGFMSLASARTDLSYSTLLARSLGISEADYRYPDWPKSGHPANLETLMRCMAIAGRDVSGPLQWHRVLKAIRKQLRATRDYYELGGGAHNKPDPSGHAYWHNIAYRGMDVGDAWGLTPAMCDAVIEADNEDGASSLGLVSHSFYRSAKRMLNPSGHNDFKDFCALRWLGEHAVNAGVENVVLNLGANNALGTVLDLEIRRTPNKDGQRPYEMDHPERAPYKWNLWHPVDFEGEYRELIKRTDQALQRNATHQDRVFVATVPYVTIAPLAKGVGPASEVPGLGYYFKYYVYFPFEEKHVRKGGAHLTMHDAILIDRCIDQYNLSIRKILNEANERIRAQRGSDRYYVVDINKALRQLAWKRNGGSPTYPLPDYLKYLVPPVNTKVYHADRAGRLRQGGLFSLDGVHPSAIGQGLIAWEFLKVMGLAGVTDTAGRRVEAAALDRDWPAIVASDTLYNNTVPHMAEFYENADLISLLMRLLDRWKDATGGDEELG